MHVDDFIDDYKQDTYARWVLNHFRLKPALRYAFDECMKDNKLFCDYDDKIWRVTGASRLGDIWLTQNYAQDSGYQLRVDIDDCTNWSKNCE